MSINYTSINTPIGLLEIREKDGSIDKINFIEGINMNSEASTPLLNEAKKQLNEYFAGQRESFQLNIAPLGTQFQNEVWSAVQEIPYGKSQSYSDIAKIINNEGSVRAVGAGNGRNPILIVIPCHRVIGQNGTLSGYSGGKWRKKWLLEHEAKIKYGVVKLF